MHRLLWCESADAYCADLGTPAAMANHCAAQCDDGDAARRALREAIHLPKAVAASVTEPIHTCQAPGN